MRKKTESQDDALPSELIDAVLAEEVPAVKSDPPYCAATKDEQLALFKECGRDKVKALPNFRNTLLSDIRKALKA